jgi:hypothetical protein
VRLTQFIDSLEVIRREHGGDIEVVRVTYRGEVRAHRGAELAHRNARYKGQLTTYEPDSGAPVVKV